METTEEQIRVGDGERSALSVTSWAGMGTGRLGSDIEDFVLIGQDGAASSGDGVDVELRHLDRDPGGRGAEDMVVTSTEAGYIGGLRVSDQHQPSDGSYG
jgi:hypothetical protein